MNGQDVPHDVYVHIAGSTSSGPIRTNFIVLEDNARHALRRILHAGKPRNHDAAVSGPVRPPPRRAGGKYPDELLSALRSVAPHQPPRPSRRSR
jgi:uncharacterized circularly permuted ATP-grasp superfamily protein